MTSIAEQLRATAAEEWARILRHPFVKGIGSGQVSLAQMRYFITQDYQYLQDFLPALAIMGARAGQAAWIRTLLRHAQEGLAVEEDLHASLAPELGMNLEQLRTAAAGIITQAYRDHLVRTAYAEPFAVAVAAVLPCYWTYQEIGQMLAAQKTQPSQPYLAQWIKTYAGEEYGATVEELLAVLNTMDDLSAREWRRMQEVFAVSMRYERLFWTQAWYQGDILRSEE
ncbi:MAG: thiaminase II [Firmicutes bacterium]|nr:thiaminase II [Bacillota bacterium]